MRLKLEASGYMFTAIALVPVAATMVIGSLNLRGEPWTLLPLVGFLIVLACMLAVGLPALRRMSQRDEWLKLGRCGSCGYDRVGLDGLDPCPECGGRP